MVKSASSGEPRSLAERLRELGVRGVLVQMAERSQLIDLRCEMPQCYCDKGREHFVAKTKPMTKWAPTPDQYPILKSAGGHLDPDNVRLAHLLCNQRDYGWRTKIKAMLAKQMTLEVIAERLNQKGEPTPPGVTQLDSGRRSGSLRLIARLVTDQRGTGGGSASVCARAILKRYARPAAVA